MTTPATDDAGKGAAPAAGAPPPKLAVSDTSTIVFSAQIDGKQIAGMTVTCGKGAAVPGGKFLASCAEKFAHKVAALNPPAQKKK